MSKNYKNSNETNINQDFINNLTNYNKNTNLKINKSNNSSEDEGIDYYKKEGYHPVHIGYLNINININ